MRKVISVLAALSFTLVFATVASAQGNGRLNGELRDKDGNPWADVTVELKNPETGQNLVPNKVSSSRRQGQRLQAQLQTSSCGSGSGTPRRREGQ
jgi:hypothetical protein